jgi:outer membrane receptor protein involved in Fe transport
VNPKWRHTWRFTWETPWKVDLSALWRFIGPTSFDNNSTNPLLAGAEEGGYDAGNARIPGYNYIDLTLTAHVLDNVDVRAGVTNLLDKDPPLLSTEITNGTQSNTYPAYDVIGRQLFVGFTAKF